MTLLRKKDMERRIRELEEELRRARSENANPHVKWLIETAEVCLTAAKALGKNFSGAFPDDEPKDAAAPVAAKEQNP